MIEEQKFFKIKQSGIQDLLKESGSLEKSSFLQQFETGYGDYSTERHTLLKDCTLDSLVKDIEKMRKES